MKYKRLKSEKDLLLKENEALKKRLVVLHIRYTLWMWALIPIAVVNIAVIVYSFLLK
jgi:hypothetical protein